MVAVVCVVLAGSLAGEVWGDGIGGARGGALAARVESLFWDENAVPVRSPCTERLSMTSDERPANRSVLRYVSARAMEVDEPSDGPSGRRSRRASSRRSRRGAQRHEQRARNDPPRPRDRFAPGEFGGPQNLDG